MTLIRKRNTVLIVAPEDDLHALVVRERLRGLNIDAFIFNSTWFPWISKITFKDDLDFIMESGDTRIESSSIKSIWWRRFRNPTLNPILVDNNVKQFCIGEALGLIRGLFCSTTIPIINNPAIELIANQKVYQLTKAKQIGLITPRTLISNNFSEIKKYFKSTPKIITKTLKCDFPHNISPKIIDVKFFSDQLEETFSPVFIQEMVEAISDIRVTIIGEKVFAAELKRSDINENIDWRMITSGWKYHNLPKEIAEKLKILLKSLGLAYGSFDLRLSPLNEYVFLEINPSGQFLFLEIDTGMPITYELAYLLKNQKNSTLSN
jgi:hypothetical protein